MGNRGWRWAGIVGAFLLALWLRGRAVALLPIDYDEDDYLRAAQLYARIIREDVGSWWPHTIEIKRGERRYRKGDKVMQIKNDYDRDVYGGRATTSLGGGSVMLGGTFFREADDRGAACGGPDLIHERADRGRLARPVRTEESEDLSASAVEKGALVTTRCFSFRSGAVRPRNCRARSRTPSATGDRRSQPWWRPSVAADHGVAGGDVTLSTPPLALYVHLPWCVRKCPYCDFNSHVASDSPPTDKYVDALLSDLECELPLVWGRPVQTIYLGGGTPSLFGAAQIERLLNGIRGLLTVRPHAEVTLEANPGTLEHDSFRAYSDAGINRVSLGVQSFSDVALRSLGRIHGREDALQAVNSLGFAGLGNFNLDLMFGLPGQDLEEAVQDVRAAIACRPPHLSHYQLTIEPNTAFSAHPPVLPDADLAWAMQEACGELLEAAGYRQYEISAWAQPGRECRHNLNYWQYGDFIGIGAGAHGKLTIAGAVDRGEQVARAVHARSRHRHDPLDQGLALDDGAGNGGCGGLRPCICDARRLRTPKTAVGVAGL